VPAPGVRLEGVPFHPQQDHHCGPASLLTLLEASGVETDYASVAERVYVPGLEGSLQPEMLAAARQFDRIAYVLPPEPEAVMAEIGEGRPVLVLLNLGLPGSPVWHYAVVVGAHPERNRILLHSGTQAFTSQRASRWLRRWDWAGRWAMVLLAPGEWPGLVDRERLLESLAAFEDTGDARAAEEAWRAAVDRWPDEPLARLGAANMAYRRGDLEEARHGYERVLELAPESLPARLNLATTLEEIGHQCEGLGYLEEAPPDGHALSTTFIDLRTRLERACPPD
jgi:tetratricopeptide (TPR) repeat protein